MRSYDRRFAGTAASPFSETPYREVTRPLVAADYPFLDLMWTLLLVFFWIAWLMILFYVPRAISSAGTTREA